MNLSFRAIIFNSLLIISMASATRRNHLRRTNGHGRGDTSLDQKRSQHKESVNVGVAPHVRHAEKHRDVEATQLTTTDPVSGECESSYVTRITEHCRYPQRLEPCFALPAGETSQAGSINNFVDAISASVNNMARSCCKDGRTCSAQVIETLCCRTPECLTRCYGPDFIHYKKIGNEEEDCSQKQTRSRGKTRRGKSYFRFLDILTKPNPARHHPAKEQHPRHQPSDRDYGSY